MAYLQTLNVPPTWTSIILLKRAESHSAERAELGVAGRRQHEVDPAELLDGGVDGRLDLRLVRDVGAQADGAAADLGGDGLGLGEVEVDERSAPALGDHPLGGGAADAAGAAGDEQDRVVEAHGFPIEG